MQPAPPPPLTVTGEFTQPGAVVTGCDPRNTASGYADRVNELSGTGGNVQGFEDHPDLNTDEPWVRQALARSRRERRRARLRSRGAKAGCAALALVVAAGAALWMRETTPQAGTPQAGTTTAAGSAGATTTSATPVTTVDDWRRVDPAAPFAGTPATTWADGAAGVTAPQAAPVGPYSAEEVAAAYERTRQVLITARLDRKVLVDHDVEPLLALFAPDVRQDVRADLTTPNAVSHATRAAREFALLPVEPKVTGSMAARLDEDGLLTVGTDYLVAYAFAFEDDDRVVNPMDVVVVTRMKADYTTVSGPDYAQGSQGTWPRRMEGYTYSMACGKAREGFIAPYYSERDTGFEAPATSAPPHERYFDQGMSVSLDEGRQCV